MLHSGPSCGHPEHTPGCGPCEQGMRRLDHAIGAHGLAFVDCPACGGGGCATCGGDGEVCALPVGIGACSDGRLCALQRGGEA